MKKIKYFKHFFMAFTVFALNACSDFLEVEMVGRVTIPNFYSDMDGMRAQDLQGCTVKCTITIALSSINIPNWRGIWLI